MAITIEVQPDKFTAVYRNIPTNWEVESTQFGADVFAASAVADDGGGFCRYTIGSHNILVNGIVTGSGFVGPISYNVRQTVTAVGATTIDTDVTFIGTDTGTITRTNDNFQIRAQILDGATLVGEKVAKRIDVGGNDRFRFNPANLLSSILSHDIVDIGSTNITTPNSNSIKAYTIKFIEEFDDVAGLLQQFADITSSIKHALQPTRQYTDDQTLDEHVIDSVSPTHKFLSHAPLIKRIGINEEEQLSFIWDFGDEPSFAYETFVGDVGDGVIEKSQVGITLFRGIIPVNDDLWDSTKSKVDVWLVDESSNQMTEKRRFIIDQKCYAHPIRIQFFNELGGFDAYTFTGHRDQTIRTKSIEFEKDLGISFSIKDRGNTTLAVKSTTIKEVWSGFLNEADRIWLTELFASTEVFLQSGTDLIPLTGKSTSVKFIKDNGLTQLRLRYEEPIRIAQTN